MVPEIQLDSPAPLGVKLLNCWPPTMTTNKVVKLSIPATSWLRVMPSRVAAPLNWYSK